MKRKISIKIISMALVIVSLTGLHSCTKDFEELNKNPYSPTETDIGPLFNSIISSLQLGWNEQFYIHNEVLYKQSQLAALTAEAWSNLSLGTDEVWSNYYLTLAHVRDIERRLKDREELQSAESLNNVRGMLKIITAYKTFRITDLFGDMPFFDAGYAFEGLEYLRPKFDTQEVIYKYLLNDLKWAAENIDYVNDSINGEKYYSISGYDNLLYGDLKMWVKFANSLRLRHAMRMAEVEPQFAGEIISEIIENDLPVLEGYIVDTPVLDEICMWPREQFWLRESCNWSFREHNNLRMGSNVWRQMSDHDSLSGSGIFDRRAFIFFEPNFENQWKPYPQIPIGSIPPSVGDPYSKDRDFNYGYTKECNYSPFNFYLVRDENDIPEILMTGAEVHYIKAEAYYRGIGVPMNEGEGDLEFFAGVRASLDFWNNVMENSVIWENVNPSYEMTSEFNIPNRIFMSEDKLSFLYSQRWLDAFRQPWEAYSLARRTGATPREGDPINHFRLPYPTSEVENNPENTLNAIGRQGGDDPQSKLWWIL